LPAIVTALWRMIYAAINLLNHNMRQLAEMHPNSPSEVAAQNTVYGMTKPMGISQYELGGAVTQHLKITREK
jgi:hypothetical protein